MEWIELYKTLGVTGIIVSALVWLIIKITEQLLARDLEKFKTDIEKEAIKHKIKFEQLHTERAQVIKEIYYQFHDIKKLCRFFIGKISGSYKGFNQKPESKEYLEYDQATVALRDNIEKNSIFFSNEFTDKMLKAVADWQYAPMTAHNAFGEAVGKTGVEFKTEQYFEMVKLLRGDILKPLEEEFKKILGCDL